MCHKDPEIGDTDTAKALSVQKRSVRDAVFALMSEEEPKPETVLHFRNFGVSVVELSDDDTDKVTHDNGVVKVVEDEWAYPHSDCGRGGKTGEGWSAGNSGAGNWDDADPYAVGHSQALYDIYGYASEPYEVGGRYTPYPPGPFRPEPFPPGSFPPGPIRPSMLLPTAPKLLRCPRGWHRIYIPPGPSPPWTSMADGSSSARPSRTSVRGRRGEQLRACRRETCVFRRRFILLS